jgi:hypothetical protein
MNEDSTILTKKEKKSMNEQLHITFAWLKQQRMDLYIKDVCTTFAVLKL